MRRHFNRALLALRRLMVGAVLLVLLVAPPAAAASPEEDRGAAVSGATALETRLLAPCCWTQTLDVHESELSSSLRAEIRRRLRAGESTGAIEEDFVARYGERIRAVQKGGDTRGAVPVIAGVAALLGALGLLSWMRRRTRLGAGEAPLPATVPAVPDGYDERLDDELRRLDA